MCKDKGIKGYSKLRKAELIKLCVRKTPSPKSKSPEKKIVLSDEELTKIGEEVFFEPSYVQKQLAKHYKAVIRGQHLRAQVVAILSKQFNRPIYIASYAHTNPKPKGIYDTDLVKTLYTMSKNNAYNFIKEGRKLSGFRANTIYKGKDGRGKLIDGVELY
jgi:hypothetical protein